MHGTETKLKKGQLWHAILKTMPSLPDLAHMQMSSASVYCELAVSTHTCLLCGMFAFFFLTTMIVHSCLFKS